jgi:predicted methyltransferase
MNEIKTEKYHLIHGDCLQAMEELGAGSVDAIICDPPY